MATMTLKELKDAIQALGFDDNAKVIIPVGKTSDGKYQFVQVDADGKIGAGGGGLSSVDSQSVDKVFDQIYHNTSGKVMMVSVTVFLSVEKTAAGFAGNSTVSAWCDSQSDPETGVGEVTLNAHISGMLSQTNAIQTRGTIVFWVNPGDYYLLHKDFSGDATAPVIGSWIETYF